MTYLSLIFSIMTILGIILSFKELYLISTVASLLSGTTFRIMGLSINDSVYSCLFFFLTGLHFFHLLLGLFLLSLLFWSCSFSILYIFYSYYFFGFIFNRWLISSEQFPILCYLMKGVCCFSLLVSWTPFSFWNLGILGQRHSLLYI